MTGKTIPALTEVDLLGGTEQLHLVDAEGNSRKVTLADLKTFINTDPTVVPSSVPFRGALARRTSVLSLTNAVFINITWDSALYDTDSIWSAGAPTRLTVPTGVTKIKLGGGTDLPSATYSTLSQLITKNGDTGPDYPGFGSFRTQAGSTLPRNSCSTGVIPVVAGDYFEFRVGQFSGASRDLGVNSWFSMEIVEATI